jgi:hypothetical protein
METPEAHIQVLNPAARAACVSFTVQPGAPFWFIHQV